VDFEPNSLGAILASGVLHYLSPSDFILAIQNIASWLKPGGKFFFATPSPYTNLYEKFFPVFQKNQEIRKEWPGYIDDISEILPGFFSIAPKQINLLDKALIEETLKRSGFEIEETNFFSINLPTSSFLEATNILGVVARKI
jgi:predicted SAM-dependent methyltransferase